MMCRALSVSRSGYYAWKHHVPGQRDIERRRLEGLIVAIFDDSDHTYGYRRIHAQLLRQGERIDDDTVRQLMRDLQLMPCQPRPFRPVTTLAGDIAGLPDRVNRDFTATAPGLKLVGDITYIRTWEGWLYLATVLDCFSKKVVGYAMDSTMTSALVCDALAMAASRISVMKGITLFHSDRGSQYMSQHFANHAEGFGILRSVGRTGVCYDNAWAESFNGTLKNERVNRTVYPTREHARKDITKYIELRYNNKRLHSALDYRTPNEVESEWFNNQRVA
jgi:transposase InsO family protein